MKTRIHEGLVISGLNLYSIQSEASWAAFMMGIEGAHPVPYEGEVWYRPGRTEDEFYSVINPSRMKRLQTFEEFVCQNDHDK